ncbi:glycosyltransferase family 87 protein [Kineococcus rhizosphaerae]|uniref:Alpha-1,2-mannosyltransferase/alpha-1, 2-mannosyltransferase n=1 Tax=Kineococcus rhizosphaerae TaxID=559628 RepID=A0A2T0R0D6_9ACTN|nr:glycosyltransferase family 87 protein [Kineococcus rhizosphaerae]PRY12573.1 alpha-1,2-mannosyltransferase/alpha-1,2-mannosyltransferase [Kineococcus rhizosphaerae]
MRSPRPLTAGFWVPAALGVALAVALVLSGLGQEAWQRGYDLAVYRDGARDLLAGRDVYLRETYRGHWFVYPPFAAVLFLPLVLLPAAVDLVVWDAVLVAVTVWAMLRVTRAVGAAGGLLGGLGVAFVALSDPFREALVLGQVSPLVVVGLVVGCLYGGRGGAVLAGLSGAVKVTPALVVAAVVNRRARWWFASAVAVVGAAATLVGVLVAPRSAASYFGSLLWDSARVAAPGTTTNNSLAGAFAHAGLPTWPATVLSVPLVLLVVFVAWRCDWLERQDRLRYGLLVSLVTCLVSPVTWSHHALAAPIAAVALFAWGRFRPLVALAAVPWLLPVLHWGVAAAETRPVSLLVLVVLLALPRRAREVPA